MENKKDFRQAVGVCKKAIADKSVSVKVKKRSNEYYDTEIITAKNKITDEEIFSLCIRSDDIGADYKLSFDNKDYVPNGRLQVRKMDRLREISEQYAFEQYAPKKALDMENKKDFRHAVGVCKKAVADKSVSVKVEKRENEYYDTEIITAKNKGLLGDKEEVFSLCIKSDPIGADYKLSFDNKNYVPNGWLQTRKVKKLRRKAERYAIKQYAAYVRG